MGDILLVSLGHMFPTLYVLNIVAVVNDPRCEWHLGRGRNTNDPAANIVVGCFWPH